MATFPGDMNIGWGFGLEGELPPLEPQESQPTDPLLAVSELEQRVGTLEEKTYGIHVSATLLAQGEELTVAKQRIVDLEERLRSLTFVVNELITCVVYSSGEEE